MFTFEPGVAFWSLLSFVFVIFFIQKFVYPPIRKVLDERKNNIAYALSSSQKDSEDAKKMFQEAEEKLHNVKSDAHKIVSEAKEKAHSLEIAYKEKANKKYRELLKEKEKELVIVEEKFHRSMHNHIAQVIVKACRSILKFDLSKEQQEKAVEERIKELENLNKL